MTEAMRYIIVGVISASVVAMFNPPWYLTLIAFWCGVLIGFVMSLIIHAWDRIQQEEK